VRARAGGEYYLRATRRYLHDEHLDKKKTAWDDTGWTETTTTADTPRQRNDVDCGVFATFCAHYVSVGVKPEFSQMDIPLLRQRMMLDILDKKIY
jgi:sentrin-specific protease 1